MAHGWVEHGAPSRARVVGGWLTTVATVAGLVVGAWALARAWSTDLPDPLAIHWGLRGQADGSATLAGTVRVTTALGLVGVAALVVVGVALLTRPRALRGAMTGLAPLAALAPASLLLTLLPNRGAPTWEAARISGWHLLLAVAAPGAVALLAWIVAARPARMTTLGPRIPPGGPVALGREPVRETQALGWLLGLAALVLAGFSALGAATGPALVGVGVLLAATFAWLAVYRYEVVDDAVTVTFGPVGPLRRVVPVGEIEGATVVTVRPGDWGEWGYRTDGTSWAVVLRSGPGVRLMLAGNRALTLSSRRAQTIAARTNGAVLGYWRQ